MSCKYETEACKKNVHYEIPKAITTYNVSNENKVFPTEDLFVISFDNANNGDYTVLVIKRVLGNDVEIVKTYYDEDAFEMYKHLTN